MPPGHSLQPLLRGLRGVIIPKDLISGCFSYLEHNSYLKTLIERVWGSSGRGRGFSCPLITFDY